MNSSRTIDCVWGDSFAASRERPATALHSSRACSVRAMDRSARSIDDYLAGLDDDIRDDMSTLHGVIAPAFDGLDIVIYAGTFWGGSDQEIVGYGAQLFTRPNGTEVDWFVVGLALQKNYISLYVNAVENGAYLSETRGKGLGKVKVGKSSISFANAAAIDLDELAELVGRAREIGI